MRQPTAILFCPRRKTEDCDFGFWIDQTKEIEEKERVGTTTIGHNGFHMNSICVGLCLCKRNQLHGIQNTL